VRKFSIGPGERAYHFTVDDRGWIRAVTRPDGSTPVIGGQFDLDSTIEVPEDWSSVDEATGFNGKIAEGEDFYPGAGFDTTLVEGQAADVLWALRDGRTRGQGRLLELGCGPGFLLRQLAGSLPGWQVTGIDPSPDSVEQARRHGLDVLEGFIDTAELQGTFDAFVVMGNFQLHVDPAATLTAMARHANPGAELYLDLKNPRSTPRRAAQRLVTTPVARNNARVHAFAAHAWHGLRHGIPKSAIPELMSSTGWRVVEIRTVAPRLLRFGNRHALARGPKGVAWRALDAVDGMLDERAWTQVAAVRA
jgi:SAM-dependent methyltransferase